MRRLSLAMVGIAMAALMTMVSCRKPNIGNGNTVAPRTMTFNATTEMGTNKTSLDGLNVNWSAGDQLSINGESFTLSAGAGTTFASFTSDEEVSITAPYYAAYPASAATYNDGTLTFNLSAERTYDATEVKIPMAALNYSDMTTVYFKNVVNVLKLQLNGDGTDASKLKSIVLKSTTSNLNGHVAVTFSGDTPNVGAADGTNTTTLSFGDTGLQLTSGETRNVYIVLPKITDGDLKIKFNCANNKFMPKTIDVSAYHEFGEVNNMFVVPELIVNAEGSPAANPSLVTTAGCGSENIYTLGGTVTLAAEAAQEVEFGLVYSQTASVPTIEDTEHCSKVVGGIHDLRGGTTTTFNVDITGLTAGTTYYVRAYAIGDREEVVYADTKTIVGGVIPQAVNWNGDGTQPGASPKVFTVYDPTPSNPNSGDETKVRFSQGNLQYIGTTATPYWKFARHQFDYLGITTGQNSDGQYKNRDWFGWGTSGWDNGNTYYKPWDTDNSNAYAYGPSGSYNLTDTYANADWGVYNPIYNGGNTAGMWRTLTKDEWYYLFNTRTNASLLYGHGKVGGCTCGVIILPDEWSWSDPLLSGFPSFTSGGSAWSNVYSYSQWSVMESLGAVFLPVAGSRRGTDTADIGSMGLYWSSSCNGNDKAYYLIISSYAVAPQSPHSRWVGFAVRLVR